MTILQSDLLKTFKSIMAKSNVPLELVSVKSVYPFLSKYETEGPCHSPKPLKVLIPSSLNVCAIAV